MLYFSTTSRLRFQQETKWVNINFERRDLTSAQESHSSPDDFGETFAFNTFNTFNAFSFHLFNTKLFAMSLKNLSLYCYCQVFYVSPYRINGGLSDKGCSSVPPPCFCLFPSLICSSTKQLYSKVDYSRMYRYRTAVFISNFY